MKPVDRRFVRVNPAPSKEVKEPKSDKTDGCAECWPSDADAAWAARTSLRRLADLVDEAHFHVMILVCPRCRQKFVSVFSETIDWQHGNDPQYWSVIPVVETEARDLEGLDERALEAKLGHLAPARRALRRDCPQGGEPRTYWAQGMVAGPHD